MNDTDKKLDDLADKVATVVWSRAMSQTCFAVSIVMLLALMYWCFK